VALLMRIPIRRKPEAGSPLTAQANKKGAEAPFPSVETTLLQERSCTASADLRKFRQGQLNNFFFCLNDLLDYLIHGRPLFR